MCPSLMEVHAMPPMWNVVPRLAHPSLPLSLAGRGLVGPSRPRSLTGPLLSRHTSDRLLGSNAREF